MSTIKHAFGLKLANGRAAIVVVLDDDSILMNQERDHPETDDNGFTDWVMINEVPDTNWMAAPNAPDLTPSDAGTDAQQLRGGAP